jgi:hypothetical protein
LPFCILFEEQLSKYDEPTEHLIQKDPSSFACSVESFSFQMKGAASMNKKIPSTFGE